LTRSWTAMSEAVRISKALADAGVASRRASDELVSAGRVTVNGAVASVGQKVVPSVDSIAVDGRPLLAAAEAIYVVAAKPAGVTSTVSDRHAERTVVELVPQYIRQRARRLYPVGRLDRDSEGLLLLTNDGDWAQRLLHPSHAVEREYAVGLSSPLTDAARSQLLAGVELEEGRAVLDSLSPLPAGELRRLAGLLGASAKQLAWYRATVHQGWKRQLRRMFGAVGAPVRRLVRIRFGPLRLAGMRLGEVRELTEGERRRLDRAAAGG
jgi:23S rRNA pseudouridine2605 synthase